MKIITLLLVVITVRCYCQDNYSSILEKKLQEIKNLDFFDNSVVVYADSSTEWSTFPAWDPNVHYYQDDMVAMTKGRIYVAIKDNKGNNPTTSSDEWHLVSRPVPYLFLRDTARVEDLIALLRFDHPYVRTYAFAALAHRKYDRLFQIVIDNLKDTTRLVQITGDYGYEVCPADLMLSYSIRKFSPSQKDSLSKLILREDKHLITLEEVLLFHKPSKQDYPFVKAFVNKDPANKFGLVALSKYCKMEDVKVIGLGFKSNAHEDYYRGYRIFFNAIENCPDKSFKQVLISDKKNETDENVWIDEYYVRALASYKDKDCLNVLTELSNLKSRYWLENQMIIYRALKTHYNPIYDSLIKEIENAISGKTPSDAHQNSLEKSPWNY